jgi:hypothetical protein
MISVNDSTTLKYPAKKRWPSFFFLMGLVGLFAVLAGFAKTFIIPVSAGSFKAPFAIYLHGAFAFGWILLYLVQTFLIHIKSYRVHMTLGILAVLIAIGVAITMLPAGLFQVQRDLKAGFGETAISSIVGICTTALLFLILVFAAIRYRKKASSHKRLMLLATIVVLWPAWFRFRHYFPSVPRPDIWFGVVLADSFIIIAWAWDKWINGKIHPVLLYAGCFIIAENIFEVITFDNTTWRIVAHHIYSFLSNIF